MRFNLISNLYNGVGLERDCQILAERLSELGHASRGLQFNAPPPGDAKADINIFVETLIPSFFPLAKRQWVMVNPEWFFDPWIPYLARCERVIAKTRHALDLLRPITRPEQLVYTGFEAREFYDPSIQRETAFLHAAGRSGTKNTEAVLAAWAKPGMPTLTVLSEKITRTPAGVRWIRRADDAALARLMNEHWFHIMPSSYEGFGHALHESLGCGAVILTTDQEPMRSIGAHCPAGLIAASGERRHHLAKIYGVAAQDIVRAVQMVRSLPKETLATWAERSREKFLAGRAEFRQRFAELVRA